MATTPPVITKIFNTADVTVYVPKEDFETYKNNFNWNEYDIHHIQNIHKNN